MGDLLIRDLPAATHDELKRRAAHEGLSLQAYVTQLLGEHTRRMPLDEWLRRLDELPSHPHLSGAEIIRATRGDDEST